MKQLTRIRLIHWHLFEDTTITCKGTTYFIGVNGVGKSTILDAIQFALVGGQRDVRFNRAAMDASKEDLLTIMQERSIRQIPIVDRDERVVDLVTIEDLMPDELSSVQAVIMAGGYGNSGWAMEFNPDASKIDIHLLGIKATEKAANSRDPVTLEDGQYTVILEPAAVGQLLLLLSFMGFGCKTLYQHRSFMAGKIGEKIAGDNFSVAEDAVDPDFNFRPFDYEGVVRKSVPLVKNGIARGVVYNSYYANLMDTVSTGHALAPTNNYGPYPKTLSVAPGDSRVERHIKIDNVRDHLQHAGRNARSAWRSHHQKQATLFQHDSRRHRAQHAFLGLDRVGLAPHQAVQVGMAGLYAEIIHLIVQ